MSIANWAARYEIRTVDGAGNVSARVAAKGPAAKPAQVFDDAAGDGIKFGGESKHENNLLLTHDHTLSTSNQKGASAELSFNGRTVLVFSNLGANFGQAAVSIDGAAPEVVDTYSADDIWGVCVFRKELATAGPHTLRLEVLGERSAREGPCLSPRRRARGDRFSGLRQSRSHEMLVGATGREEFLRSG